MIQCQYESSTRMSTNQQRDEYEYEYEDVCRTSWAPCAGCPRRRRAGACGRCEERPCRRSTRRAARMRLALPRPCAPYKSTVCMHQAVQYVSVWQIILLYAFKRTERAKVCLKNAHDYSTKTIYKNTVPVHYMIIYGIIIFFIFSLLYCPLYVRLCM